MTENSPSDRRAVLEGLQREEATGQGPLLQGLRESDPIVVASFYNPYYYQRFQSALSDVGISSESTKDGITTSVEVQYNDRKTASEILAVQQSRYPDHRPTGIRKDFDFTIFGGLLGAVVGVISWIFSDSIFVMAIAWLGFFLSGLMVGRVTDRLCHRYRYFGRFQLSLASCFLLTTATALLVSIWLYLYRLL